MDDVGAWLRKMRSKRVPEHEIREKLFEAGYERDRIEALLSDAGRSFFARIPKPVLFLGLLALIVGVALALSWLPSGLADLPPDEALYKSLVIDDLEGCLAAADKQPEDVQQLRTMCVLHHAALRNDSSICDGLMPGDAEICRTGSALATLNASLCGEADTGCAAQVGFLSLLNSRNASRCPDAACTQTFAVLDGNVSMCGSGELCELLVRRNASACASANVSERCFQGIAVLERSPEVCAMSENSTACVGALLRAHPDAELCSRVEDHAAECAITIRSHEWTTNATALVSRREMLPELVYGLIAATHRLE